MARVVVTYGLSGPEVPDIRTVYYEMWGYYYQVNRKKVTRPEKTIH